MPLKHFHSCPDREPQVVGTEHCHEFRTLYSCAFSPLVTERTVPRYGEWYVSRAGKKEVYFFFRSSEKRGEADVLEGKHVQEYIVVSGAASFAGRQAGWCEIRDCQE